VNNIKIIYCNGCSWTSGSELADHAFFQEWPGEKTNDQAKLWFENDRFKILDAWYHNKEYDKIIEFIQLGESFAWPAQLSKLLDLPVVNDARSGNSQEHITITSIDSLLGLLKSYNANEIQCVIQLTSPYRSVFPQYKLGDINFKNKVIEQMGEWVSVVLAKPSDDVVLKQVHELLCKWPDYHLEKKYILEINHLVNFCAVQGIRLKLFKAWNFGFDYNKYELHHATVPFYVAENFTFDDIVEVRSPGGHPGKKAHIDLANFLIEHLWK